MTEQEIQKVRKSLKEEWHRQTFDAFLLGMEVLRLTGHDWEKYVKAARTAVDRVAWASYDTIRKSFMDQAEILLQDQGLFLDARNALKQRMYIRFMEGRIRYFEFLEQKEKYPEAPVPVGVADFHNTELAAVFAHLPEQAEVKERLKDLNIHWDYEQLHLVTFFSSQLSLGSGDRSRSRPNHSARVTYQHLVSPESILWIASMLGEKEETIRQAAGMAEQRQTYREKSVVIRNVIPWSRIYGLALTWVEKERETGQN